MILGFSTCLQAQYQDYRAKAKDAEDSSVAFLDQIEELTHKLSLKETELRELNNKLESIKSNASEVL